MGTATSTLLFGLVQNKENFVTGYMKAFYPENQLIQTAVPISEKQIFSEQVER